MREEFYQALKNILNESQILIEEPLAKHTTFQIGGPAKFLLLPETISQVKALLNICKKHNMLYYVIGNGSNLLVSDKGFPGVIIKLGHAFSNIMITSLNKTIDTQINSDENGKTDNVTAAANLYETKYLVTAQAGVLLSKLANEIAEYSLEGFEFAAGIPGTLGGAVTMNAGAYDGQIKDSICSATLIDPDGNIVKLSKDELNLGYRSSIIQTGHYIVLEAEFSFQKGNKEVIKNKINDLNGRRREKQPLEYPSAGSTFKRPEGFFAGKLIMDSGLRGYQVGKAQVSEKHCGFVINKGGATAAEVKQLISDVINIVYEKFNVKLEPEVKFLGEF